MSKWWWLASIFKLWIVKEEKIESQLSQKSNYTTCRRPTNLQSQEKKLFFSFWYSRVKKDVFDVFFNHIKNLKMFSRIVATSESLKQPLQIKKKVKKTIWFFDVSVAGRSFSQSLCRKPLQGDQLHTVWGLATISSLTVVLLWLILNHYHSRYTSNMFFHLLRIVKHLHQVTLLNHLCCICIRYLIKESFSWNSNAQKIWQKAPL